MPNESEKKLEKFWTSLPRIELNAKMKLTPVLAPWEKVVKNVYLCGVEAPFIAYKDKETEESKRYPFIYLNRALNDLRVVWLLLNYGYTSQAASIGASLIETSLTISALLQDETAFQRIKRSKPGESPFNARELAQIWARGSSTKRKGPHASKLKKAEYEAGWRGVYGGYKYLCGIKHGTLSSLFHDALGTNVGGACAVMASPDLRDEDARTKITICSQVLLLLHGAIEILVFSNAVDKNSSEFKDFQTRTKAFHDQMANAFKETARFDDGPLAVDTSNSKLAQEWRFWTSQIPPED